MTDRPHTPRPLSIHAPERPDPTVGHVLAERYRIVDLVARGGMARVYRARDVRLDRDVAVKVLSLPYADDPAFTERFLAEARAAASVSHPNLVHVYDSGSDGALHFIVMELLERYRSLREVLADRTRLPAAEAVAMARQILAGLDAVHRANLVHCDVKSGNVMLGPGPAKLIDFGIARSPAHESDDGSSIGSLHYMSPEQLRGEPLTPASDLFALGVVLYEALTGRVPYRGDDPGEIAAAQRTERPAPPSTLAPEVPGRLGDAVVQALRLEPAARFGSARAMDRALEAAVEEPGGGGEETTVIRRAPAAYVPPRAPQPAVPAPRRHVHRAPAPRRHRSIAGLLGTATILGAAVLVGLLVIVPLLRLGAGGGSPPSATATPAATPAPPPGTVAVPNTIGLGRDEAIEAANAAGLNWTIRCNEDPAQPEGIIDQEPAAGATVPPGSRFTMYSARIADCR